MIETFYTTDLLLAGILKTKGFQLIKCETKQIFPNQYRVVFHFEKTDEILKEVDFFLKTDDYPFKKFYGSLIELKKIIWDIPPLDKNFK